jgi:hypothetical protein
MIFYDIKFTGIQNFVSNNPAELLNKLNKHLDLECSGKNFMAQAYEVKETILKLACCYNFTPSESQDFSQLLAEYIQNLTNTPFNSNHIEEITTHDFYEKVKTAEEHSLYQKESLNGEESWAEEFSPDVLASPHFETKEYVFKKGELQEKVTPTTSAHYQITATSFENAKEIVDSIVSNSLLTYRIWSGRTTFVKLNTPKINNSFENEVDDFFARACGTTVVIDLESINIRKNTINSVRDLNQELWNSFEKNILEYANDTLFVFVENGSTSSNADMILDKLADKLEIVKITLD